MRTPFATSVAWFMRMSIITWKGAITMPKSRKMSRSLCRMPYCSGIFDSLSKM